MSAGLVYMVPGRRREGALWTVMCVIALGSDGNLGRILSMFAGSA